MDDDDEVWRMYSGRVRERSIKLRESVEGSKGIEKVNGEERGMKGQGGRGYIT